MQRPPTGGQDVRDRGPGASATETQHHQSPVPKFPTPEPTLDPIGPVSISWLVLFASEIGTRYQDGMAYFGERPKWPFVHSRSRGSDGHQSRS